MIRTPPQHNTKNPPGQINFEQPLAKSIEEFRREEVKSAYQRGWDAGYKAGQALATKALDPSSEECR